MYVHDPARNRGIHASHDAPTTLPERLQQKDDRENFRINADVKATIRAKAETAKMTVSDFYVRTALGHNVRVDLNKTLLAAVLEFIRLVRYRYPDDAVITKHATQLVKRFNDVL